ncbi:MAG: SUMF1/EgtB/PvdO family nonheme iron enzyme [Polyangiaceae bacterium]
MRTAKRVFFAVRRRDRGRRGGSIFFSLILAGCAGCGRPQAIQPGRGPSAGADPANANESATGQATGAADAKWHGDSSGHGFGSGPEPSPASGTRSDLVSSPGSGIGTGAETGLGGASVDVFIDATAISGGRIGMDPLAARGGERPAQTATEGAAGVPGASNGADAIASSPSSTAPEAARGRMLLVPAGPFTMGADSGGQEDERPAHTVTLAAFWLDRVEVTNADWDECVIAHACRPKSDEVRARHPDFNGPKQPVSGVSWDDARTYCAWRGERLPREAEYEKAVRDGDGRRFPWGNDPPTLEVTVFASGHPADVGTHPAGRGPYGHDDLAGNVWEWMEDEYDPYAYRRSTADEGRPGPCSEIRAALDELRREHKQGFTGSNPIPDECEHSIRGGAYNYDAEGLRATNRVHHPGRYRIPMLGVRCAKDAAP